MRHGTSARLRALSAGSRRRHRQCPAQPDARPEPAPRARTGRQTGHEGDPPRIPQRSARVRSLGCTEGLPDRRQPDLREGALARSPQPARPSRVLSVALRRAARIPQRPGARPAGRGRRGGHRTRHLPARALGREGQAPGYPARHRVDRAALVAHGAPARRSRRHGSLHVGPPRAGRDRAGHRAHGQQLERWRGPQVRALQSRSRTRGLVGRGRHHRARLAHPRRARAARRRGGSLRRPSGEHPA